MLTLWWQQGVARVAHHFKRSEPSHDHSLWLWPRLRLAGNQPVCDQDRGPAENGRSCLSQGEGDATGFSKGAAHFFDAAPEHLREKLREDAQFRVAENYLLSGLGRHAPEEDVDLAVRSLFA